MQVNVRDRKGLTPLQHALRGPRNRECAVILLESGAQFDVDIFETDYGTLLHEMYVSDDTAHLLRLTELMLATGPEDLATAVTCNDGDTLLNKLLKFFGSARPRERDEYVNEVCTTTHSHHYATDRHVESGVLRGGSSGPSPKFLTLELSHSLQNRTLHPWIQAQIQKLLGG